MQAIKKKTFQSINSIKSVLQIGVMLAIVLSSFVVQKQPVRAAVASIGSESATNLPTSFWKTSPDNGSTRSLAYAIVLAWASSTGASSYQYCINSSPSCPSSIAWISTGTNRNVTLSGLVPGNKYYWQARATNTWGSTYANAATSNWWSFTTSSTSSSTATKVAPTPTRTATGVAPTSTPTSGGSTPTATTVPPSSTPTATSVTSSPTPTATTIPPTPNPTAGAYYVSPSGNDSNPGTKDNPFKTIQKGVNVLTAGKTLYVRGGTYNEAVTIKGSGTSGNPITIIAYPGETPILNGGSSIAILSSGGTNYWTIQGLTIQSTNRYSLEIGYWGATASTNWSIKGNTIYGSSVIKGSNNTYDSNNISGVYPDGSKYGTYSGQGSGDAGLMDIDGSNHDTFISNKIHDFTNYDARGIWTQGYTHDNVIEYNTVTNIMPTSGIGQSIDLDGAGSIEWNHTVLGNTVVGNNYVGIQLENVFNSTIKNNIIQNTGSAGIIDINYASNVGCPAVNTKGNPYGDTNGNGTCKDEVTNNSFIQNLVTTTGNWGGGYGGIVDWGAIAVKIQGNTITSPSSSGNTGINFQTDAAYASQAVVQDNIIMIGKGVSICSEYSLTIFTSNDHNVMYNGNSSTVLATGSGCTGTPYTLAAYQSAFGLGQGSIQANPLFANSSDFHITASSPAIDKGISIGLTSDIAGTVRPQSGGVDIGAYEH
jgi:hypothetical protein